MADTVGVRVSHERIYRHLWADKKNGGDLYTHLRIANGLIRQYIPKQSDLRRVEPDHIQFVQDRLNRRPRKTLDYATPEGVFLQAV